MHNFPLTDEENEILVLLSVYNRTVDDIAKLKKIHPKMVERIIENSKSKLEVSAKRPSAY